MRKLLFLLRRSFSVTFSGTIDIVGVESIVLVLGITVLYQRVYRTRRVKFSTLVHENKTRVVEKDLI